MDPKKYKSKVDLWIAILLILIVVLGLFDYRLNLFSISANESIALGISGIVMILSVFIFLPVNYTLLESHFD